ncbi:hypothetical protein HU200_001283 [Digitaria exilis]|uniref:NADP-dependent oxidoreductase domain-containing protein n=1 Tax=Digitaria exilis TaxID=1010633 RepID=A0A835G0F3_9POAL|nr:hypothetical protein HU200_001283 [Digitaria exilis]
MAAAPTVVPRMKLGSQGLEVSAQGLGCMGTTAYYGPPKPEPDMIALIHHAVATGVTLLDTADSYGPHTNEILLGKALLQEDGLREKVELVGNIGNCKFNFRTRLNMTINNPSMQFSSRLGSTNNIIMISENMIKT